MRWRTRRGEHRAHVARQELDACRCHRVNSAVVSASQAWSSGDADRSCVTVVDLLCQRHTQAEVAVLFGVSQITIWRICGGTRSPRWPSSYAPDSSSSMLAGYSIPGWLAGTRAPERPACHADGVGRYGIGCQALWLAHRTARVAGAEAPATRAVQPAGSRSRRLHQADSGSGRRRRGGSRSLDGDLRPRGRASPPVGVAHGSGRSVAAWCRAPRPDGSTSAQRRSGRPCGACRRHAGARRTL